MFRAPSLSILFSTLIGIGSQCIMIALTVGLYGNMALPLNEQMRDNIYMLVYVLSGLYGAIAGFVSARLYKLFNGTMWLFSFYLTAAIAPFSVAVGLLFIDFLTWLEKLTLKGKYGEFEGKIDPNMGFIEATGFFTKMEMP